MTYLVTGAGGFVGLNLVEHLLAQGHRVRAHGGFPSHALAVADRARAYM